MSNKNENEEILKISKILMNLNKVKIGSWDINERGRSISNHIRLFENTQPGIDEMAEDEKAREFIATLRGLASTFVEGLDQSIRSNYTELKKELITIFHKEKSVSILMKEFNQSKWKKNKQSIKEFAALLGIQWRTIAIATDKDYKANAKTEQAILKNRLLDSIKDADVSFGSSLEFYITDNTLSFKELANLAEAKWELFKENNERIAESEYDNDVMFMNAKAGTQKQEHMHPGTHVKSARGPRNKIDSRPRAEACLGYRQNSFAGHDREKQRYERNDSQNKIEYEKWWEDSAEWHDVSPTTFYGSEEEFNYPHEPTSRETDKIERCERIDVSTQTDFFGDKLNAHSKNDECNNLDFKAYLNEFDQNDQYARTYAYDKYPADYYYEDRYQDFKSSEEDLTSEHAKSDDEYL